MIDLSNIEKCEIIGGQIFDEKYCSVNNKIFDGTEIECSDLKGNAEKGFCIFPLKNMVKILHMEIDQMNERACFLMEQEQQQEQLTKIRDERGEKYYNKNRKRILKRYHNWYYQKQYGLTESEVLADKIKNPDKYAQRRRDCFYRNRYGVSEMEFKTLSKQKQNKLREKYKKYGFYEWWE